MTARTRGDLRDSNLAQLRMWALRTVWVVLTIVVVMTFALGIPARRAQLTRICETDPCNSGQLGPGGEALLQDVGLSVDFFAWALVGLEALLAVIFLPIAAFIFWRGFSDWMAIVVSLTLALFVGTLPAVSALLDSSAAWQRTMAVLLPNTGNWAFFTLLYLFPNGRFTPRWTRWLPLVWIPLMVAISIADPQADGAVGLVQFVIGVATGVIAQAYRYWRVSGPVERQQTKWAVFGFTLMLTGFALSIVPNILFPRINVIEVPIERAPQLIYISTFVPLAFLGIYALPVTIAFSVLRYRLWDIDFIIRRTLAYGLVMTVLGVIYVGSITLLQSVVVQMMGSTTPLVLVVSTLATVALFAPLRRRVQNFVDRRFNRSHYDATRTLEQFGDVARDEVDLEKLESALLAVVSDTMQPTQASLWVNESSATESHTPTHTQ